jgi:hypothetical protein
MKKALSIVLDDEELLELMGVLLDEVLHLLEWARKSY